MGSALNCTTVIDGDNFISTHNSRESMGNDQRSSVLSQLGKGLLDRALGLVIQSRSSLIQNEQRRVLQEHTRNRNALLLSARKSGSTLSYLRVISIWQRFNELSDVCTLCCQRNVFFGSFRTAVCNVLRDSTIKEVYVLLDHANCRTQTVLRNGTNILPINGDASTCHIVESRQ